MRRCCRLMMLGTLLFTLPSSALFGGEPALTLALRPDAEVYVLGVPVFVQLTLRNVSAAPLTLRDVSAYLLEVKDSDGVFKEVEYGDVQAKIEVVPTSFEAGKQRVGWTDLLFRTRTRAQDERQLIFPLPGAYTFRMRGVIYLVGQHGQPVRTEVLSNEVQVTVAPPEKGFEAFLTGLRKHTIDARLKPEGVRWMEQFIKEYPDTTYAQYAKGFIIGHWCDKLGREEEADKVQSDPNFVRWAGDVVEKLGTRRGFISCNALYVLALSHLLNGEPELAEPLKASLGQEFPGNGYLKKLAQLEEAIQSKGLPSVKEALDRRSQMAE